MLLDRLIESADFEVLTKSLSEAGFAASGEFEAINY